MFISKIEDNIEYILEKKINKKKKTYYAIISRFQAPVELFDTKLSKLDLEASKI